jgi:hypothetical protein
VSGSGNQEFNKEVLMINKENEVKTKFTLRATIDLSQIEDMDTDINLKVAVVKNQQVLKSMLMDLKKVENLSAVPIKIDFDSAKKENPGHISLVIGPDVPNEELLAQKPYCHVVSKHMEWKDNVVDLKKIAVSNLVYKWWWLHCKTYTITGKVICANGNPVPGANVTAFEVDRWWWWFRKDQLKTAVTDVNGNFEMKFKWCCWWPFFLLKKPLLVKEWEYFIKKWAIDPILVQKIKTYLKEDVKIKDMPDCSPHPDLNVFENLLNTIEAQYRSEKIHRFSIAPESLQATGNAMMRYLPETLKTAEFVKLHIWPWYHFHDCRPDILFQVTQDCQQPETVIYEATFDKTYYNIANNFSVTLTANENACCSSDEEIPEGTGFKFANVGCTPVMNIGGNDPNVIVNAALKGFAYPGNTDRPFAEKLSISGVFCEDANVDYYQLQYSSDNGVNYQNIADTMVNNFYRVYWGTAPNALPASEPKWNWILFPKNTINGKVAFMSREKYETDNQPATWGVSKVWTSNRDLIISLNSHLLADGHYVFRLMGFNINAAGNLVNERVMQTCGLVPERDEQLTITLDNRTMGEHAPSIPSHPCGAGTVHLCTVEPDCDFIRLVKNENPVTGIGTDIGPCGIVKLKATDQLTIHFQASDKDGHLEQYQMTAHYGESAIINLLAAGVLSADPTNFAGPTYALALAQGAARPIWNGGKFKLQLPGSAFPTCCAYTLKLRTWKRTYDGCTASYHFHWNVCEYSFTIIREDLIGSPAHPECSE